MGTPGFIQLLTSSQSRIYAYILSMVFDPDQADEILQQTNVVLWEKEDQFELGTNFIAWSFRVAYFQVCADRKRRQRDRLVFDDEVLKEISQTASRIDENFERRHRLLRRCLDRLNDHQRGFIRRRYEAGATLGTIADETGKQVNAVKQILFRARRTLINCVNAGLSEDAS